MGRNPCRAARSRHGRLIAAALSVTLTFLAGGALDQPSTQWNPRLEALTPSEPLAYFELAEEIADASSDATSRELARHLFALAGALDPDLLGRSACLALAEVEPSAQSKRRLLALASLMEGTWTGRDIGPSAPASQADEAAVLAVAEALGRYRAGQGALALGALRKPGAMELLKHHERMLPGGLGRFLEDCKLYKGQQRPPLTSDDITRMLQLESALLGGSAQSWDSELMLTAGQPLIEVDPTQIEQTLGVNSARCYYRHGRWVERPN